MHVRASEFLKKMKNAEFFFQQKNGCRNYSNEKMGKK